VKNLTSLHISESATIKQLSGSDQLKIQLQEIGFVPGSIVKLISSGPFGDPMAFQLKNATIALRKYEAEIIQI